MNLRMLILDKVFAIIRRKDCCKSGFIRMEKTMEVKARQRFVKFYRLNF